MHKTMLAIMLLLPVCAAAQAQDKPILQITTTVDFGEDRGQNFGSLFEATDADGEVVYGAGFAGLYNTAFRMDRLTLQFFVRGAPDSAATVETLPPPSNDGGTYLFDFDGRLYQFSYYQDMIARWWDDETGGWQVDESFGRHATTMGEGKMRIAGKVMQFKSRQVYYDGELILPAPKQGHHHQFYYANGHLSFFHMNRSADPPYSRIFAVPWKPGDGALDLSKAITFDVKYPGETPFSIGQLGDEIIQSSNMGGVYVFDGKQWRMLVEPSDKTSYQLYSMLNWYDKLLMAQYPTGNLFEYDGKEVRHLKDWPPVMPGVSGSAREAQTTCIYGGDLYVGVWPWSELWRYDAHEEKWHFVRRNFEHPLITDKFGHPWEDKIAEYNRTHEKKVVRNSWGQRVTGLNPIGDALYIAVSAKGCFERDPRLDFLKDDAVWNEYRAVHRMRKPGCAAAAIQWTGKPTTLRFTVTDSAMTIDQDGKPLISSPITAELAAKVRDAKIRWGHGMFGPLRATLRSQASLP